MNESDNFAVSFRRQGASSHMKHKTSLETPGCTGDVYSLRLRKGCLLEVIHGVEPQAMC